jgi:hypothetical protein
MDTQGAEVARPWIEAAKSTHPSLIDQAHVLGEKLGIVNVPMSAWIDENGVLVRLGDAAFTRESPIRSMEITDEIPEELAVVLREAKKIQTDHVAYLGALGDWAEKGADSQFAWTRDELMERTGSRSVEAARAAACFELGQHLYRSGNERGAVPYWRDAHKLDPGNWTYKRQAWSIADPNQGPTDDYDGNWIDDVKAQGGGEAYYPLFNP